MLVPRVDDRVTLRGAIPHPHPPGIAPAADGASPVRNVDAVWVPDQPVVALGEVGAGVFGHGAVHIVEHRCLIPTMSSWLNQGPGSPKKTGSNLNRNQERGWTRKVEGGGSGHRQARVKFPISADATNQPMQRGSGGSSGNCMADPSDRARKTAKCLLCFAPQAQHTCGLASTHWRAGCCVQPQRVL